MAVLHRIARLAGTIVLEVVALLALVVAGRRSELAVPVDHLGRWLRAGDAATVVVALLRWIALLGAAWMLVSTLLYLAATLCRAPAAVRAIGWSTVPAVRRVVDAACAVTVATSVVLAPTAAHATRASHGTDPPSVSVVRDGRGIAQLPADTTSAPTTTSTPAASPAPATPPTPEPAPAAVDPPAARSTVTVAPGDNLWVLAAREIARVTGRAPDVVPDDEVAPYWVLLCDTNRARLASGDPNLVFPGEQVVLPPVA
jgi:hypothetical protein